MNEKNPAREISNFERLLGRQATPQERENLRRVKDVIGLKDNDALWSVLIALEYHHALYDAIPDKIRQASIDALASFNTATKIGNLKNRLRWICATIALICFLLFGIYMTGTRHGHNAGFTEATMAAERASWSQTEMGKKAHQMALNGDLERILNCDQPGWVIKNGACYPHPSRDGTYGWQLP